MKDSGDVGPAAEIVTEVELSAQDLLELSPSVGIADAQPRATRETPAVKARQPLPAASIPRRVPIPRAVLALSVVAVAVTIAGLQFRQSNAPTRPLQTSMSSLSIQQMVPIETPDIEEPEQSPIQLTNPFDSSEVFEFPAGTSKEEARAVVADLLMQRATERQALIGAPTSTRR